MDTARSVAERYADTLDEVEAADLDPDPLAQLDIWLGDARAAGVLHPEAMALATATPEGAPSVRMVLLKGCDTRGITFFTNLESRKAKELEANPRAAAVLHWWQPYDRQVRVEGAVRAVLASEAQAYFDTRPLGSRLAAWASPQSRPVDDRAELERLYAAMEERFAGVADPPLPPHWGGFLLVPDAIELWQNQPNRLHDRIRFVRDGSVWRAVRLAP
jgi:pyridoxamine 5'-phosphate oxidase